MCPGKPPVLPVGGVPRGNDQEKVALRGKNRPLPCLHRMQPRSFRRLDQWQTYLRSAEVRQ